MSPLKLCVSIAEPTLERACAAAARADRDGAFAEIRLDALDDAPRLTVGRLAPLCPGRRRILTFRTPGDGGRHAVDDRWRLGLLAGAAARYDVSCDVEVEHAAALEGAGLSPDRVVLSHHDFERTPHDLGAVFERMASVPAGVYKLATRANGVRDLFAHFGVLGAARAASRPAVAIAMGPKGFATRVLGPAWGGDFTFCAPDGERGAAPGQAPLAAMRDLYRVEALTPSTLVTGLVAGTSGYSLSPAMHNAAARDLGVDVVYAPFEVEDLVAFLEGVRSAGWRSRGFSVTNPFKTEALALVDEADPLARRAGAVNTIVVDGDRLVGYNTDVEASVAPLEALVGPLAGLRVGVLGAGGAARAIVCGLAARGARVAVFARRAERARAVAEGFGAAGYGLEGEPPVGLDVLVNATPVGTRGLSEGDSPVPSRWLAGVRVAYDLVYAPERTRFLQDAGTAGCRTIGGLPMLAAQAARQFELWTGRAVDASRMLEYARRER